MHASSPTSAAEGQAQARTAHWRCTRRLTLWLALTWFALTFGTVFFARELAQIEFFGWTLSFYLAAQGATLLYLVLVTGYAWQMRRLDRMLEAGGDGE